MNLRPPGPQLDGSGVAGYVWPANRRVELGSVAVVFAQFGPRIGPRGPLCPWRSPNPRDGHDQIVATGGAHGAQVCSKVGTISARAKVWLKRLNPRMAGAASAPMPMPSFSRSTACTANT